MSIGHDFPAELDVDLAGLSAVAASWFARLPVSDQRVQSVPDGRTLRFYQSTGLLDRPVRYDGRVARYGRRHLLQLLAIRALQSKGFSLAQVQTSLAGATDDELQQSLNAAFGNRVSSTSTPVPVATGPSAVARILGAPAPVTVAAGMPAADAPQPIDAAPAFMAAELAPGVVITIDSRFQTDPARLIALLRRALQGEDT